MAIVDWKAWEQLCYEGVLAALDKRIGGTKGTFYAVVFHEFYGERGGMIALPWLAANTVELLGEETDSRWSSADWKWTNIKYASPELRKAHRALQKEAAQLDDDDWAKAYQRYVDSFIRVAKSISKAFKKHPQVTQDFGAFVFTEENEVETLRKCVSPARFRRLFPNIQEMIDNEEQLSGSPVDQKLALYRKDLWEHRQQIIQLGHDALPLLLDVLQNDKDQDWAAADLIGEMGLDDPQAIALLRRRASTGKETCFHDTTALAMLGDHDFLFCLTRKVKTRKIAVEGILSLYNDDLAFARKIPLDYRLAEQVLSDKWCQKQMEKERAGGRPIQVSDIDEALRGLDSAQAWIRQHAVCCLGDKRLGKKQSERILPSLAEKLNDRRANVRRLAIISFHDWGKLAKPYLPEIRNLAEDRSEDVADTARHYVKEIRRY
ncbi:hypothetical protein AB1L30_02355 [Bremerella sp. JC817]|uniref:hypothetical protein n=1 Tax=Bremerella sp. JC817 TaxID=3231756 RepID=UPI00345B043A